MGKYIPGIIVTAETLKYTPDSRKRGEKTLEARMRGTTRVRIVPVDGVYAEEDLDILHKFNSYLVLVGQDGYGLPSSYMSGNSTYHQERNPQTLQDRNR
jgi:hypothetical protein